MILEEFYNRDSFGLITTHYSNLKLLANELPAMSNANMQFDSETLEPIYKLALGEAGSSFTFEVAQKNAIRNHVKGKWFAGKVEEIVLDSTKICIDEQAVLIVDPPRAGLHPKAAQFLTCQNGAVLYYVACNPKSLSRDREILEMGHWKMTDLWTIDLFPQTPHVESIAKFVRK